MTKIVSSDEAEILNITRFTNSQNSVREQDFIALHNDFRKWADEMANEYRIFLEIQRGGIESRKAYEKQNPDQPKFEDYVYAFDLIKVYGRRMDRSTRLGVWQKCSVLASRLDL